MAKLLRDNDDDDNDNGDDDVMTTREEERLHICVWVCAVWYIVSLPNYVYFYSTGALLLLL